MTAAEMQIELGGRIRAQRLAARLSQAETASRSGCSLRALQRLEIGAGSTLETFIRALKALGLDALDVVPSADIQPMDILLRRRKPPRQRAPKSRHSHK